MKKFNLYAFGCSYTKYFWPTWADIIGKYAFEYKNFGKRSAGNYFIFHQLINFVATHKFNSDDIIAICWSGYFREDRIKNSKWIHGNVASITDHPFYDDNFVEKFFDLEHYLERDKTLIIAAIELLEAKKINYVMFSMNEMFFEMQKDENFFKNFLFVYLSKKSSEFLKRTVQTNKIAEKNKESLYLRYKEKILNSISTELNIYNKKRPLIKLNGQDTAEKDFHPTPEEQLYYVEKILLPKLNLDLVIDKTHRQDLINQSKQLMNEISIINP